MGSVTVPEKSQPITFAGGSDMEACLSGSLPLVLLGLEKGVQTVCWVQRDVGHLYEYFAGGGGGDGDGVERWGAEEARHERFHCCGRHYCCG